MYQFIRVSSTLLGLLFCCMIARASTVTNPITVNLERGPITLVAGATGTASYLVSVDAGVQPNAALTMNITPSQPWATVSQATSTCITPTTTCTSPISLFPGQHCCLMLTLDGTQLAAGGNYTLSPSVATNPAGFGGNAAPQTVTVTAAPIGYTVTIAEGANGTVAPLGAQTVAFNGNTTLLTATPAGGQIVDYWLYTGTLSYPYQGGGLNSTFYNVTEDATIEAFFVPYTASITVPAAPTDVVALNNATTTSASLAWSAPMNTGGADISFYQVTPFNAGVAGAPSMVPGQVTTTTFTGLTPANTYTFTVQATNNAIDYGPAGYSSAVTIPTASIAATPSSLALKVGGNPRTITFYNNSMVPVSLLGTPPVTVSGLPGGTNFATTCVDNIAVGGSCTATITPGSAATTNCTTGISPTAGTVTLHTTVGGPYTASVYVLSYGCQYQGGYIYSIDDTTPTTSSIGGKVVATSDQAAPYPSGILWSSTAGATVDYTSLWGIDEQSLTTLPYPNDAAPNFYIDTQAVLVPGQLDCNGGGDGSCNTNNIYTYYKQAHITLTLYAAGLCKQPLDNSGAACTAGTPNCYIDWYLPSLCEMGYFNSSFGISPNSGCGTSASPTLQNMQTYLVDTGIVTGLAGSYWSSTENSSNPHSKAWFQSFSAGSGSLQFYLDKFSLSGVRCSRALTL